MTSLVVSNSVESGGSGTYNLNGGTLILSALSSGSGTAAFNFGGGTLQAGGSFTTTVPMTLTGSGGNATVDTAGNTVTLSGLAFRSRRTNEDRQRHPGPRRRQHVHRRYDGQRRHVTTK